MTAARFCPQCGRDAAGAAFCPYCGVPQAEPPAATQPPPPPAAPLAAGFCPNCGSQVAAGLAFCNRCGTNMATGVPLAQNAYVAPAAAQSKTPIYAGAGAVVVALIVAFFVMSGGDDESSETGASSSLPAAATSVQGAPAARATATPAGPRVATAPQPKPGVRFTPTIMDITSPAAAADIRASLQRSGLNLQGVSIDVFHVTGTDQNLLVFDADSSRASALNTAMSTPAEQRKFARAIIEAPSVKEEKITRLAINLRGSDNQGAFVMGMTMPMTTLEAMANGTLPEAELAKQVQIKLSR